MLSVEEMVYREMNEKMKEREREKKADERKGKAKNECDGGLLVIYSFLD